MNKSPVWGSDYMNDVLIAFYSCVGWLHVNDSWNLSCVGLQLIWYIISLLPSFLRLLQYDNFISQYTSIGVFSINVSVLILGALPTYDRLILHLSFSYRWWLIDGALFVFFILHLLWCYLYMLPSIMVTFLYHYY